MEKDLILHKVDTTHCNKNSNHVVLARCVVYTNIGNLSKFMNAANFLFCIRKLFKTGSKELCRRDSAIEGVNRPHIAT